MNAPNHPPSPTSPDGAPRVGVWFVGACGGVATLTAVGARAVARGLRAPIGLLTESRLLDGLDLPSIDSLVFGGHEIRNTDLHCAAREFAQRAGILDRTLLDVLHDDLVAIDKNIRPGYLVNAGPAVADLAAEGKVSPLKRPLDIVRAIQEDLRSFQTRNHLAQVIVINVSSTEPPNHLPLAFGTLDAFETALHDDEASQGFACSVLYAYASLDAGFPYINFTPSPGSTIPALHELANKRRVPHMGSDGKTGETLVKTALAPMFSGRALRVLSWEGYNMLGNRDGYVLNDPSARESKTRSKDRALRQILGDDDLHAKVSIDYVPSLDDWKVAWDFIHFEGFLGTKMTMQFTWQGNDSALAAPLVIDLARLAAFAQQQGEYGVMTWTAGYFKSPAGVEEQNFVKQLALLEGYVAKHRAASKQRRPAT